MTQAPVAGGRQRDSVAAGADRVRPRLGVLATHAIQYQAPLYRELTERGVVDLEVAFLSDEGTRSFYNADFGTDLTWDMDLLAGYQSLLLGRGGRSPAGQARWAARLAAWVGRQDIVVVHGHADPAMMAAALACRVRRRPYLLRGESHAEPAATGWRRTARHALASATVRGAAGALPIGRLNAAFYDRYGRRVPQFSAPYSVDSTRFAVCAQAARGERAQRLSALGLDPAKPVAVFSGKLIDRKRPLDVVRAVERCGGQVSLLLLGDGPLREEVRGYEGRLPVRCLGFVNQSELPGWYACGEVFVLPSEREAWGVVVNEAMACGLVPVVSDAVGCAPDLVAGVGEVFRVGDTQALAQCLLRASEGAEQRREQIRRRLERFTVTQTALGYERAALALGHRGRR